VVTVLTVPEWREKTVFWFKQAWNRIKSSKITEVPRDIIEILETTDYINTTTQDWLLLQCDGKIKDQNNCMADSIHNVFVAGSNNIFQQTVDGILFYLSNIYEDIVFRGAYFVPYQNYMTDIKTDRFERDAEYLICRYLSDHNKYNDFEPYISLNKRSTASISYKNTISAINIIKDTEDLNARFEAPPLVVSSTASELKKTESKRLFNKLHRDQNVSKLASIVSIPIITVINTNLVEGKDTEPRLHGVFCLDCNRDGFFDEQKVETIKSRLKYLTRQLAIGSLIEELINRHRGKYPDGSGQKGCSHYNGQGTL
jgi:hypothetical protein